MSLSVNTESSSHTPSREQVELILGRLDRLPTLPAIAARLLALTTSSRSSVREVVEVIESDPSLTVAILRLVRRADLGIRTEGMTVARAVKLLGFGAVRNAALSIQVYGALAEVMDDERAAELRQELWKHGLAVACTADMLAAAAGGAGANGEAFVCGLLHDIGKVALEVCLPKSYARVVDRTDRSRTCICDVEHEVLGVDHTVAGKRLVKRWQLAPPIVDCVWLHHQDPAVLPSAVADPALVRLVHLADNLVRRQRVGYSGYGHVIEIEEFAARLGLDPGALDEVMKNLPERMEPLCELVGLDNSISRSLYAESLVKANKELTEVNAELAEANRNLWVRSACFDAISGFTERLTERDRISDVCLAAAESIRTMLGIDCVLICVGDASARCLHLGRSCRDDGRPEALVCKLDHLANLDLLRAVSGVISGAGIVAAPVGCDALWQRHAGSARAGPLWTMPFLESDTLVGAALFVAEKEAVQRLRSGVEEMHAVAAAIRLAVASTKARVESERLNEEALELNRRIQVAQTEAVRARSVSMIAEMAAGAAHELNNPLSVISGRAQLLRHDARDQHDKGEPARTLKVIIEQARAASQIVTDLMSFAKPEPPQAAQIRLATVLEARCQHWRGVSGLEEQQLRLSLADAEVTVYADADQLRDILDSVLANAVEACPAEPIRLQVNSPSRVSDETVRIVIEDKGVGMTRAVLERAIDPFFSHRRAGRRRGLGLSRAYRLAAVNGGNLWLESTPNVGTTVTIELPARAAGS